MWSTAGTVKRNLQQYPAADAFFTRAIAAYGADCPAYVRDEAAEVKSKLVESWLVD